MISEPIPTIPSHLQWRPTHTDGLANGKTLVFFATKDVWKYALYTTLQTSMKLLRVLKIIHFSQGTGGQRLKEALAVNMVSKCIEIYFQCSQITI